MLLSQTYPHGGARFTIQLSKRWVYPFLLLLKKQTNKR